MPKVIRIKTVAGRDLRGVKGDGEDDEGQRGLPEVREPLELMPCLGFRVWVLGFDFGGIRVSVQGLTCKVGGLGFRVESSGCRV